LVGFPASRKPRRSGFPGNIDIVVGAGLPVRASSATSGASFAASVAAAAAAAAFGGRPRPRVAGAASSDPPATFFSDLVAAPAPPAAAAAAFGGRPRGRFGAGGSSPASPPSAATVAFSGGIASAIRSDGAARIEFALF